MDKKVVYALLGGAAVIGAAIAYHFYSSSTEGVEDEMDAHLDELGPLQKDHYGNIKFDQFLKIFQICSVYGKTQFSERKKQLIKERREALAAGNT